MIALKTEPTHMNTIIVGHAMTILQLLGLIPMAVIFFVLPTFYVSIYFLLYIFFLPFSK
jgi:hypothetical protein